MPTLPNALRAWSSDRFATVLKAEIEALPPGTLPLQHGIDPGSHVDDRATTVRVLHSRDDGTAIQARVGVFFTEIIASCGCGAEPVEQNAYCELHVRITKQSAQATFELIAE